MGKQGEDVERFHRWELDALEDRAGGSQVLSFGPFRAVMSPRAEEPSVNWVTLIEREPTEDETLAALTQLQALFKQRGLSLEVEFNEAVYPRAGIWLESAGMKLAERNPLMACRPDAFRPSISPDVTIKRLSPESQPPELEAFQRIRWTDGGEIDQAVPSADRLRTEMGPNSIYMLASLEGEPAGTGVAHALKGAAEIVGVVTRIECRRRGVAATVTSNLVQRHLSTGGDFVFLDAANEDAARIYERLGFSRFGANVVYR
jgi:predicted GNAT family acetyltransferase